MPDVKIVDHGICVYAYVCMIENNYYDSISMNLIFGLGSKDGRIIKRSLDAV